MTSIDIINISMFQVRFGASQPSKLMSELLQVRHCDAASFAADGWTKIPEAGDSYSKCFCGKFEERNPFNIPGPFYGAQTDTCATGPIEAPNNVMLDVEGQEFVYRQPTSIQELRQIIGAARCDPFAGYGADGDEHWNLQLIREWWQGMAGRTIQRERLASINCGTEMWQNGTDQWFSFCTSRAEIYLRHYAFFVENRRLATPIDSLPEL